MACFETKLVAEESAKVQVQKATSEGSIPKADPIVVMEVEVPLEASKTSEA